MEWTEETMLQLVNEIYDRPIIWDPNDPQKKNKKLKNKEIATIAAILETTPEEVVRKWKIMAQSYRVYRRKAKKKISSGGAGANDVYKPSWFAFDAIHGFMNDVYTPQDSVDTLMRSEESDYNEQNDEDPDDEESQQTEYVELLNWDATTPTSNCEKSRPCKKAQTRKQSPPRKILKSSKKFTPKQLTHDHQPEEVRKDVAYELLLDTRKRMAETELSSKKEKDECDIFGELIAAKLKKEDPDQRDFIMNEIYQVLYNCSQKRRQLASPATDPLLVEPIHTLR